MELKVGNTKNWLHCSAIILVVYSSFLIVPSDGKRGFTCKEDVHKSLCLPENYSKFELPFTEKTNQIGISIDIDDVLRINDGTYSITFSTYFNVEWNERRLSVQPDFGASLRPPQLHGSCDGSYEPRVYQGAVGSKHFHLQSKNIQSDRRSFKAGGSLD